jgi:iron complex transport system permease protein
MKTGSVFSRAMAPLALLALGLGLALFLAVSFGPSSAGWGAAFSGADRAAHTILVEVRLPRAILAMIVGAGLAGAGVAFQALLRNPLADPYILGVSGGAALGAVLFTTLVSPGVYALAVGKPLASFAGAALTLFLLFYLARVRGRTGATGLLLVGVILNAFYSAVILFLVTASDPGRFQQEISYLVGSLAGFHPWVMVAVAALLVACGLLALFLDSHRLNLLSLGGETAAHLGVDVERTTWAIVIAASLVTAAGVTMAGLVGFVGLIVPHALRIALGPDHRILLPASALGGAMLLVLADTAARVVLAPVEIPVGVLTALVGGPFFLFLFLRRYRGSE